MYVCAYCDGSVVWRDGSEDAARDRAGLAIERDSYECEGCRRRYRRVERDNPGLDGTSTWWGVKQDAAQPSWDDLPADRRPRWSSPPPASASRPATPRRSRADRTALLALVVIAVVVLALWLVLAWTVR